MGRIRNLNSVLVRKPERKNHYEELDIGGRIILRLTFEK
jgi:hypothetical protein